MLSRRVIVKPTVPADHRALYALIDLNRVHLSNLIWIWNATLETTHSFVINTIMGGDNLRTILFDGNVVGLVHLRRENDHDEIGYWIAQSARNRGVMSEAVRQVLQSTTKLTTARIKIGNIASYRILTKNAFVPTQVSNGWIEFQRPGTKT